MRVRKEGVDLAAPWIDGQSPRPESRRHRLNEAAGVEPKDMDHSGVIHRAVEVLPFAVQPKDVWPTGESPDTLRPTREGFHGHKDTLVARTVEEVPRGVLFQSVRSPSRDRDEAVDPA